MSENNTKHIIFALVVRIHNVAAVFWQIFKAINIGPDHTIEFQDGNSIAGNLVSDSFCVFISVLFYIADADKIINNEWQ